MLSCVNHYTTGVAGGDTDRNTGGKTSKTK